MGAGCVYVCILWCFLLCVHVCGSACALASLSHMCGACAVSAGLGEEEEELGDSRAQRRDSDRQAGSAWALTLGLLRLGAEGRGYPFGLDCTYCCDALVFNHVLPPTHASLFPSFTPTPTIPDPQVTLKPLPYVVFLKV